MEALISCYLEDSLSIVSPIYCFPCGRLFKRSNLDERRSVLEWYMWEGIGYKWGYLDIRELNGYSIM